MADICLYHADVNGYCFLMVTYRLLKNFNYDILAKDAAIVSIMFSFVFQCIIYKHLWVFEFENVRYIILGFHYICALCRFYYTIFVLIIICS